jgi:hypothetical protein
MISAAMSGVAMLGMASAALAASSVDNAYHVTVNPTAARAGQSVQLTGNGQYNTAPFTSGHCDNQIITVAVTYWRAAPATTTTTGATTTIATGATTTTTVAATTTTAASTTTTLAGPTTTTGSASTTTTTVPATTTTTLPAGSTTSQVALGKADSSGNLTGQVSIPAGAGPTSVTHEPAYVQASCTAGGVTYQSNRVSLTVEPATTSADTHPSTTSPPVSTPGAAFGSPSAADSGRAFPTGLDTSSDPNGDLAPAASPVSASPHFTG